MAPSTRSNTPEDSGSNHDLVAAKLAAIAAQLDLVLSLKDDIEVLKTLMYGTPFRYTDQSDDYDYQSGAYEPGDLATMTTVKSLSTAAEDGYGEEDEVHVGPDNNINLAQELEHGDKDVPEICVGVVEKHAAVDDQPQNISKSTSSSLLGDPCAQQMVSSMVEIASNCSLGQSTTPVKLQFGLFSGPTLIPSPIPSIEIRSIQMPFHLHQPVCSSVAYIHPSQATTYGVIKVLLPKNENLHAELKRREIDLQPKSILVQQWVYEAGKNTIEWLIAWLPNPSWSYNDMPRSIKQVYEGGAATIEWLIAWRARFFLFDLRTSRLSGLDVLIQTR